METIRHKYWYIVFSFNTVMGGFARASRSIRVTGQDPYIPLRELKQDLEKKIPNCKDGSLIIDNWLELTEAQFKEYEEGAKNDSQSR